MIGNKCKENENGITLLGLILTIIILLILAGISIAMLTGENGIINKAKEHEIEAQLAIIEEAANIIYVEKNTLGIKNVELSDIVRQLQEDGYEIKVVFGDGVKEIVLEGPDIITIKKEYVIAVRPDKGDVEVSYYAVVKDKYFEIKNKDNGVEVVRTESDLSKLDDPNILSASTPNAGYININRIDQEEKKVIISGQNPPGREILTVTYGKKSAEKQIKVLSELEYLNEVVLKDYTEIPEDIKEKLAQEDYVVEDKTLTTIEDILLTSPEYMPIDYTSQITAEIKSSSETNFYAVIDEEGNDGVVEYYKIVVKDGQVQAESTPTNVNIETQILEAKAQNELITVGTIDCTTNPITIPITSQNNTGTETITVIYGSETKDCNIEVLSKLEYLDKLLENEDDITDAIIENVKDDGYTIEKITKNRVTDINIDYPNTMATNSTSEINVTCQTTGESFYCAVIDGKYYKIIKSNNKVIVEKTTTNKDSEIPQVTASSSNSAIIGIGTISGMNIPIISGASTGTSTITVVCGDCTKTCNVKVIIMPTSSSSEDRSTTFPTDYGTIDVIWLDSSNNVIKEPNAPILTSNGESMTPVTWTFNSSTNTWSEDDTAKLTWYNYTSNGTDRTDNTTSQWANAKTKNGAYFVWIPRYAYRITYYESATSTEPTGYYDGWGQWKAEDGAIRRGIDTGTNSVVYKGNKYIVHPAFETDLNLGGWSSDLNGFWFAKYEMSGSSINDLTSIPNVQSLREMSIGNQYLYGRQATYGYIGTSETLTAYNNKSYTYTSYMSSHMMKNSEWGAVAYLTHSKYGRNGNEIDINNSSDYYTGNGGGSPNAGSAAGIKNAYNTKTGAKASSTGNIYGIYDLSGGARERNAYFCYTPAKAFTSSSNALYITREAMIGSSKYTSNKYITCIEDSWPCSANLYIYKHERIGNATREVNTGGTTARGDQVDEFSNWFSDEGYIEESTYFVLSRGGYYKSGSLSGIFSGSNNMGGSSDSNTFRTVLCP